MPYYVRKLIVTKEFLEVVQTRDEKKFDKYIEHDGHQMFPPYGIRLKPDDVKKEAFREATETEVALVEDLVKAQGRD